MKDKVKSAFQHIYASPELIHKTAAHLHAEAHKRGGSSKASLLRFAAITAVCVIAIGIFGVSSALYFTPTAYIDMDVNPSIELTINRFGRVIRTSAYNDDATALAQQASQRNKPYADAVGSLLDEMIQVGYLQSNSLVSITVQSSDNEDAFLREIEAVVANSLTAHHTDAETEIYGVSQEVKQNAHAHHISPAKYIAITELQTVDESASYESCAGHSLSQIREQTQAHSEAGHDSGNGEDNLHHGHHGE